MKKSDFYFDLPKELIAQTPLEKRDESRLLVVDRASRSFAHKRFYNIIDYLNPGDLLVLNDSKVIPARIFGIKEGTGAHIEFLLLKQHSASDWEVLVKPGRKVHIGTKIIFGNGLLQAEITDVLEGGNRMAHFHYEGNIYHILDQIGQMPLPPYITEKLKDKQRYQTVYAKETGSAAAPTAGLHFTQQLLEQIRAKGINIAYVTLHVGLGTFRPVKTDDILQHHMHTEHYYLPEETADLINQTKKRGDRVIAVGTTSCRTLESVASREGKICPSSGDTDIFIYPGYQFKVLDGLITNFHLPESTLIMLVSAFADRELILDAYTQAIAEKYRFFSFGDAMLVI